MKEPDTPDQAGTDPEILQATPRYAYTLAEIAALCGRSPVWAYRRVYAGELKVLTQRGSMMVSKSELDRFLSASTAYSGKKKRRITASE